MKYTITITQPTMTQPISKRLVLEAEVMHNDFNEHDTAAILFALEFAANGFQELSMRVHIEEKRGLQAYIIEEKIV